MRKQTFRLMSALLAFVCWLSMAGCQPREASPPLASGPAPVPPPVFAIVVKYTTNPYMAQMYEGFAQACRELGVEPRLAGPGDDGSPSQSESLEALLREGVAAIAIAANDRASVSPPLKRAVAAGIPVVSLDSIVDPQDRMVHIQQTSPEMIGRVLIQAGTQMIGGQGQIAILTTTPQMPNQSVWVTWMHSELTNHPDKYTGIELVDTVYGQDERAASAAQTRGLLKKFPDLKLIIAPTSVGLNAAAEVITETGASTRVTGLGLPSEMEPYITSGVCPWMYLWNPSDLGYLAAQAMHAMVDGRLTGAVGQILPAGSLGDKVVTACEDGGSEIVLGNPKLFDASNIVMWKEVF